MGKIIGIDLGTTNSVVAVMEGNEPVVVPNAEGGRTTPSVVAFKKDGERLVGAPAKRQAITNPQNTVFSVKRFMGRQLSEVAEETKTVPYTVTKGDGGVARIGIDAAGDEKLYTPQEISAMVLGKLKQTAEDYLGERVTEAVITVPAYFNDAQRQATKEAGQIAGLEVKRILNEPTAAALAYGLDKTKDDEVIAVYDLGGGTYDISILELGDGVFEVKSTNGDTHLGGDDFDQRLIDWIADEFKSQEGIDLRNDPMALQAPQGGRREGEDRALGERRDDDQPPVHHGHPRGAEAPDPRPQPGQVRAARTTTSSSGRSRRWRRRWGTPASRRARSTRSSSSAARRGSRRSRRSSRTFSARPRTSRSTRTRSSPSARPSRAASCRATSRDVLLLDVTPLNLGIETLGSVMTPLIPANTTIPTRKSETFSTASDNQPSVEIHVLQGDRSMAVDNRTVGRFHLDGIPPAPRGVPQIEVTFDIDADGILSVSAKDKDDRQGAVDPHRGLVGALGAGDRGHAQGGPRERVGGRQAGGTRLTS